MASFLAASGSRTCNVIGTVAGTTAVCANGMPHLRSFPLISAKRTDFDNFAQIGLWHVAEWRPDKPHR